uniref:Tyrosine kinase with immunoglobulin like and EGF like domains 1 n=1 Tax=Homo sapiens TaxID=9606 RepID=A0AAQ5BI97_HUMAN
MVWRVPPFLLPILFLASHVGRGGEGLGRLGPAPAAGEGRPYRAHPARATPAPGAQRFAPGHASRLLQALGPRGRLLLRGRCWGAAHARHLRAQQPWSPPASRQGHTHCEQR